MVLFDWSSSKVLTQPSLEFFSLENSRQIIQVGEILFFAIGSVSSFISQVGKAVKFFKTTVSRTECVKLLFDFGQAWYFSVQGEKLWPS